MCMQDVRKTFGPTTKIIIIKNKGDVVRYYLAFFKGVHEKLK